jgi:hypothetical protein
MTKPKDYNGVVQNFTKVLQKSVRVSPTNIGANFFAQAARGGQLDVGDGSTMAVHADDSNNLAGMASIPNANNADMATAVAADNNDQEDATSGPPEFWGRGTSLGSVGFVHNFASIDWDGDASFAPP